MMGTAGEAESAIRQAAKNHASGKKLHNTQAGPQHSQDGWSSRANRRWGSSWGDGELSPALLPSLCPLPRLALTGHGALGLRGEVDGCFSLGPPARAVPGLHRVAIGLRLPQVLDQHHALLGLLNQHLLHGPNGHCKARARCHPPGTEDLSTPHTLVSGYSLALGKSAAALWAAHDKQHQLKVIPKPNAEVNLQEKPSVAGVSQITPSWHLTS